MDTSRHIIPEIYNYNNAVNEKDIYRILNMVDIDKVNKNTKIVYKPMPERNILYIPDCYKSFEMIIALSSDIDVELACPIHQDCSFIIEYYTKFCPLKCQERLVNFLKLLPENTKSVELSSICYTIIQHDIIQYLPRNLKKYKTPSDYTESLDNLSPLLELLSVSPAISDYNYAFLPLTLHTLEIKNSHYASLPEFINLNPGLKVLSLDNYTHNLASLPEGLEKLFITYYNNTDTCTEFRFPPNLKTLQICNWTSRELDIGVKRGHTKTPSAEPESGIKEYPVGLEHLDIDSKVDITKLPSTLKSLGLYGFNLSSNIIELPANIMTIYTEDDYIEQLPAHIKRVVIIIKNDYSSCCGVNCYRVRVGDVLFEIDTPNTDECFMID